MTPGQALRFYVYLSSGLLLILIGSAGFGSGLYNAFGFCFFLRCTQDLLPLVDPFVSLIPVGVGVALVWSAFRSRRGPYGVVAGSSAGASTGAPAAGTFSLGELRATTFWAFGAILISLGSAGLIIDLVAWASLSGSVPSEFHVFLQNLYLLNVIEVSAELGAGIAFWAYGREVSPSPGP